MAGLCRQCQGWAIESLISDCIGSLGLRKLILFTGENNVAAQGLYETLGLGRIGEFALLFGLPGESDVS